MPTFDASIHADYILDLGEKNCSQLIMEVMLAMQRMDQGQTLLVTAYDSSRKGQ
jgi:TusA-related sulfurtransferase